MSKKIIIINNGLDGGGTERASVSLANYYYSLGYDIIVLALYKSDYFFKLSEGISFIEPGFQREPTNRSVYVIKMMFFVRNNIKRLKPDTILAFNEWTNPFVVLATRGLKVPLFLSDRMNPRAKLPFVSDRLKKMLYKKADGIIAQTEFAKTVIQKKTKAKNIKVVHNPVNAIDKLQCEPKKRIVSVGRLAKVKGHQFLVEAFARLDDKNWELSIVGDGEERTLLEKLAARLGISDRVIFHGHLHDFTLQLSEAQIFVLPSIKEGFPNALIEAMSVPLACISTDFFEGHNEIIDNGINGLLVRPGDVNDLATALNHLTQDAALRLKLAANAYEIRKKLKFEKIARQILDFIFNNNEQYQKKS